MGSCNGSSSDGLDRRSPPRPGLLAVGRPLARRREHAERQQDREQDGAAHHDEDEQPAPGPLRLIGRISDRTGSLDHGPSALYQSSSVWSVPMSWPRSRTKPRASAQPMTASIMPGLPHRKMSKFSGVSGRPVSSSIAPDAVRVLRKPLRPFP